MDSPMIPRQGLSKPLGFVGVFLLSLPFKTEVIATVSLHTKYASLRTDDTLYCDWSTRVARWNSQR